MQRKQKSIYKYVRIYRYSAISFNGTFERKNMLCRSAKAQVPSALNLYVNTDDIRWSKSNVPSFRLIQFSTDLTCKRWLIAKKFQWIRTQQNDKPEEENRVEQHYLICIGSPGHIHILVPHRIASIFRVQSFFSRGIARVIFAWGVSNFDIANSIWSQSGWVKCYFISNRLGIGKGDAARRMVVFASVNEFQSALMCSFTWFQLVYLHISDRTGSRCHDDILTLYVQSNGVLRISAIVRRWIEATQLHKRA